MYRYDSWLENLRMSMTEKECPALATCYKCNEDLYEGDNVFFWDYEDIYLCERCVSRTEDEDEDEYKLIKDNFDEITLENYDFEFFEEDKYEEF